MIVKRKKMRRRKTRKDEFDFDDFSEGVVNDDLTLIV